MQRAHRLAFEILKQGAVQPRRTFDHLLPSKPTDFWKGTHYQRITRMLIELGRELDHMRSEWRLVRVSSKGQEGLYQLRKRNHAASDAPESHSASQA